ncbi:glucosyltransferase [Mycobacterium phage Tonenili]|uniref:Glycosyltransferase n=1 Tax=Mycobacterium phage Tonenili TaxID=1891703 RepID=A0A1C9EHL6_9CAUD|nr:glucosyltransferase [Mycobacterium phage Tonenili]AON96985.1 glycosyltransferase [Mycobacterium phage Tonenili]
MINIAVVACQSRQRRAENLAQAVGAEFVAVDDGTLGPGANHDVAWRWLDDSGGEWSVVLEDDAIPVAGFRGQLAAVLKAAPSPIVSLYLGRSRPPHWQLSIMQVINCDEHFLLGSTLLHHVAVAIKTDLIFDMLAERDRHLPVDESIGTWARGREIPVAYAHPSIVDHEHRLPTTILERTSGYAGETGRRGSSREVRKAWTLGSRKVWGSTTRQIPNPTH